MTLELKRSAKKLTTTELTLFELKYKIKLPKVYKDLILKYNGGRPKDKSNYGEDGHRIYFFSIKYGQNDIDSLIEDKDDIPEGFFPFGDASGEILYMSLRKEDYGTIYENLHNHGEIRFYCNSLEELIEGLYNEDEDEPLI